MMRELVVHEHPVARTQPRTRPVEVLYVDAPDAKWSLLGWWAITAAAATAVMLALALRRR